MSRKLELAETLSAYLHEDQFYGNYDYYEAHIIDVVNRVILKVQHLSKKEQEDHMIVAYLHDVLEDSDLTYDTIDDLFGTAIAEAVKKLSHTYNYVGSYGIIYRTDPILYAKYIEAIKTNPMTLTVKICDTESNLAASIRDGKQKRIDKYTKQLELLTSDL